MLVLEYSEYQVRAENLPLLFYESDLPSILNWIARGTDGNLYIVPAIAGGWLQRKIYEGCKGGLEPISPDQAYIVAWFLYGDMDHVTIASTQT